MKPQNRRNSSKVARGSLVISSSLLGAGWGGGTGKPLASHDWKCPLLIWVMVTWVPKYVKTHQAVYLRFVLLLLVSRFSRARLCATP